MKDMVTDIEGKIYLYLPKDTEVSEVSCGTRVYENNTIKTTEDGTAAGILFRSSSVPAPETTFSFDSAYGSALMGTTTAMEYSVDGGTAWFPCTQDYTTLSTAVIAADKDIRIRVAETDQEGAGAIQTIDITQSATPVTEGTGAVAVTDCKAGQTIGTLTGVTSRMEYRKAGDSGWKPGNSTGEITGLTTGAYEVRVAATGTVQASEIVTLYICLILTGDGGEHPYELGTAEELYAFSHIVNGTDGYNENQRANAVLTDDIDLNPGITFREDGTYTEGTNPAVWTPMSSYQGTFDGQNHTIAGVYIGDSLSDAGLFAFVGKSVHDVGVVNSYVNGVYAGGISSRVGGVAIVQHCYSTAYVKGSSFAGGICGTMDAQSKIQDCYSASVITAISHFGGICGWKTSSATIANSYYMIDGDMPGVSLCQGDADTTGLDAAAFANGMAAYRMNTSGTSGEIWRQNLDQGTVDPYPVLDTDHQVVYYHEGEGTYEYSNYEHITKVLTNKNYPTNVTYTGVAVPAPISGNFTTDNVEVTAGDYSYTWYVGQNADGSVTGLTPWRGTTMRPIQAGSYTLFIQQAATATYTPAATTVKVNINKALIAPNTPTTARTVAYSVKTVGAVTLPTGWTWAAGDRSKSLIEGKSVTATANYTAGDAGNYQNVSVKIAITRSNRPQVKVKSVTLNQTVVGVKIGKTATLKTTVAPSNATNKAVTYKSSNTKVATVSSTGRIKGIKSGTCTITVTAKDGSKKKDTVKVTVSNQTITYKLNKGKNSETNPETYLKSQTVNLKNPTRKGYTFKGWYANSKFKSSSKLTKIKKGNTKNFTLYAKWQKVTVAKASTPKLANSKAGQLKVTYAKTSGAAGYELTYATNSKFTKNKVTTTLKGTSKTFTKLKKNTTYYVRIRAYKTDSTGAKVYGKYSSTKSLKLKK